MRATFSHAPLADSVLEFRLLRVLPGADDDQIESELSVHSLGEPPEYCAVSYTWGSAEDPVSILVNGKVVGVNQNCWYALWQVRHRGAFDPVFIDSICIDQANLEEKAAQVQGMSRVYRSAKYVLASLGTEANDSTFLVVCLQRYHLPESRDPHLERGEVEENVQRKVINWLTSLGDDFGRFSIALKSFSRRSFFSRLWIYQEMFLAPAVILVCGTKEVNMLVLRDLVEVGSTLIILYRPFQEYDFKEASSRLIELCNEHQFDLIAGLDTSQADSLGLLPVLARQLRRDAATLNLREFRDLPDMLNLVRHLECKDPRDKIFGLVGIWEPGSGLVPDYNVSTFQLALNVLQAYSNVPDLRDCVELADLLCVNLGLSSPAHCEDAASQATSASKVQEESVDQRIELHGTPWACRISRTGSGHLTAPFRTPWSFETTGTTSPSKSEQPHPGLSEPVNTSLLVGGHVVALISSNAAPGDWIAPLGHYTDFVGKGSSNYRFGLILREEDQGVCNVIGEVAFLPWCQPCFSYEDCACQFGPDSHERFATSFAIKFHCRDLLLMAMRLRGPFAATQHANQLPDHYQPQLPSNSLVWSASTTAVRHDSFKRLVQRVGSTLP